MNKNFGNGKIVETRVLKLGLMIAGNEVCVFIKIFVKVVLRDMPCYVIWKDLNRPQPLTRSIRNLHLIDQFLLQAEKERQRGCADTHFQSCKVWIHHLSRTDVI